MVEKETQNLKPEDVEKSKKKGGIFGDPVFVVGDSE